MKHSKLYFSILGLLCMSLSAISQDVSINILQQPAAMKTNTTGTIRVDIDNNDGGDFVLPANKIRPLISVPAHLISITGVTGLPAGWFVCSNDGSNIRISNGTGTIAPGERVTFFINVASGNAEGIASTITGTMAFAGGNTTGVVPKAGDPAKACSSGSPTVENEGENDNSTTSVAVIAGGPLPVKLTSFTAKHVSSTVETNWEVENEISFSHYEVERSNNGGMFTSIGKIAAVNSKNYSYTDKLQNFYSSVIYYRLKMVDKDGNFTYSKIQTVIMDKEEDVSIKIYPNPVMKESALNIELGGLEAGAHSISMIAVSGAVVKAKTFKVPSSGSATLLIFTSNMPSGTYTVVIKGPTHQYARTVVVAK